MKSDIAFWRSLEQLLITNSLILDRPKGTAHPHYKEMIYPLDYGYLENTISSDGGGIDVWLGSLNTMMNKNDPGTLTGILCTFDTIKRDAEIKLLIGCSETDIQAIRNFHKDMPTLYIPKPVVDHDLSKRLP